jgi:hypothetical protein
MRISRQVIAGRVKRLIDGFPDTLPHAPEIYAEMMVEEIIRANPSEAVLAAACQHFLDKWYHLPAIADMIEELAVQEREAATRRLIARVKASAP